MNVTNAQMLERGYRISSSWKEFTEEIDRLKCIFSKLKYPQKLVNSIVRRFIDVKNKVDIDPPKENKDTVRFIIPYKDQRSADFVKNQIIDLSNKTSTSIQPVFVNDCIDNALKVKEIKPDLVNNQCVIYRFQCDLCDASYIGYTKRHLFQRVTEHKQAQSSIFKHYKNDHGITPGESFSSLFNVIKKCTSKFNCLVYEMLYIQAIKPSQSDSLRAKLFI